MSENYYTHGIPFDDLEKARRRVEKVLGVTMKGWTGEAYGNPLYSAHVWGWWNIEILPNWNAHEAELNFPDHPDFPYILTVAHADDPGAIYDKLMADKVLSLTSLKKAIW